MSASLSDRELRLTRAIESRAQAMLDDLRLCVALPTGFNNAAGLDELRSIVTGRLAALGAKVTLVPGDDRPDWLFGADRVTGSPPPTAVCARLREDAQTRVLLASHLDTVFDPACDFRELTISADGRRATGPGCVDMKGGFIIALHALEALEEAGVDASWTYAFNSDEEMGSFHSQGAIADLARKHDVGLATEPALPDGALAIERNGSGSFRIDAFGKSAHVGRAFAEGVSAVTALAQAIVEVGNIASAPPGHIASVGPIVGGPATNIVPDHAVCWGNARYATQEEADVIGDRLDALATAGDALPRVQVRRSFNRPPKPEIPATRALALRARQAAEDLGQHLPFASTGGVCDGNNMQAAGLPTIDTLGVRGGGLHTTDEWIDLTSLVERASLLAILMARLSDEPFTA